MNSKKTFYKRIMLGISLFLCFACNDAPSGVITISNEDIRTMIPTNFSLHSDYKKISINDTVKLRYDQNQFLMKNQMSVDEKGYISISDTISDRILRRFQVMKMNTNKYSVKFDLIDLESDEIPSIFGGSSNKNFVSRPFSLVTYDTIYLTEDEKESLERSLFSAFK